MTYLDLVNRVLRKLREDEVTTVSESSYSKLIGDFVNDALNAVEASWDWSSLRTTLSITALADQSDYALEGFGIRGEIMSVYNTTNKTELTHKSKAYILDKQYKGATTGTPRYWTLNGTNDDNDGLLVVHPTPNDTNFLEVNVVLRNQELVNDGDSTKLPTLPIIQLAFAYALRERGETGGQSAMEQIAIAKQDLSNAIALDAGNNSGELVFTDF